VPWSVERNGPVVREAIEVFGVERCMFASNFPVDSVVVKLSALFDGFKSIVADLKPLEQLALFHDTLSRCTGYDELKTTNHIALQGRCITDDA